MDKKKTNYEKCKELIFRDIKLKKENNNKKNYYYHLGKMDALYNCGLITKIEREDLFSLVESSFRDEK